ncbi:MAG: hypothetical protein V3U52_00235 [Thermoplasmata archaeon]
MSALIAVRVTILMVGSLLTLFALNRYYRSGSRDTLLLSVGFGFIAFGALMEGLLFEFLGWSLVAVHTLEAGFSVLGLSAVLLAILLGER